MIQAFVTGFLGGDAEIKQVNGEAVCSFSVASGKKGKGGAETTTWVRCSLWGKRGPALAQYLTKGQKVAVAGELSTREHNGKVYVDLRVGEVDLMSKAGGGSGGGSRNETPRDPGPYDAAPPDDSEIPF